jgi:4-amino-4-deoxy-L-arabinose transferase-like glycosyltransferase
VEGSNQLRTANTAWWREGEIVLLLGLVLTAHFFRAGAWPLRGEEPRRAQIAFEMVERGDWIVPREQGEPFYIRPPLQNWLIALSCIGLENWGVWAVRLPSLMATLLTTLIVYWYARQSLSRLGALAAGSAFTTFADIFKSGVQAETEAIFTLLVGGSLLVWHGNFLRRGATTWTYASGYALMALAMLTKGIQAPAYYLGSIGIYLLLTKQWRLPFCRAHLLGSLAGVAILLAWIIPYAGVMGWQAVPQAWFGDPAITVNGGIRSWRVSEVAKHFLTFPLEIAAGTLPWSVLLVLFLSRDFRRSLGEARAAVTFLTVCTMLGLASCWIPPGALPRYLVPLYPCIAVLIGFVVQRCSEVNAGALVHVFWNRYLAALSGIMVLAAAAILILTALGGHFRIPSSWAEPPLRALVFALTSVALAALVYRVRGASGPEPVRQAVLAVAAFLVIGFTGVMTDVRGQMSERAAQQMEDLKTRLPPGQQIASIDGHTHALFAYLYGRPLIALAEKDSEPEYFCFQRPGLLCPRNGEPRLPFAWEEVGVICVDRNHHPVPDQVVVVGRRLPTGPALTALPPR